MEQLIEAAALVVIVVGVIASIFGLIQFTRCFGNSGDPPSESAHSRRTS